MVVSSSGIPGWYDIPFMLVGLLVHWWGVCGDQKSTVDVFYGWGFEFELSRFYLDLSRDVSRSNLMDMKLKLQMSYIGVMDWKSYNISTVTQSLCIQSR
jgi:hypothetical protein